MSLFKEFLEACKKPNEEHNYHYLCVMTVFLSRGRIQLQQDQPQAKQQ
jgi:hypothetical protein